jgi:hypothetical protein
MSKRRILIYFPPIACACIFVVFCSSCVPKIKEQSAYMKEAQVEISAYELQLRMHDFANSMAGDIELAADQIISSSDDPEIDRNALLWKMNAIPVGFTAAFAPDPLLALVDSWVFCKQMLIYFEEGAGKNLFGKWRYIAIDASRKLESKIEQIANKSAKRERVIRAKKAIEAGVRKHPIESILFVRKSALDAEAELLGKEKLDLGRTVQTVNEGMTDLRNRMSTYTEYLPKQARWQGEYLTGELLGTGVLQDSLMTVNDSLSRITKVIESSPKILDEKLLLMIESINDQRVATFEELRKERIEVVKAIQEERVAVLEAVRQERIDSFKDLDAIISKSLENSFVQANKMVNRIFLLTAILLIIIVVLCFTAFLIMRKRMSN